MKEHWEKVYQTKQPNEVSWTQAIPQTSLDFIKKANLEKDAAIIDIGGGDSNLVDFLLNDGYTNITVLDISAAALERSKLRLGNRSSMVNWVESDIIRFQPDRTFYFWHDRAAFHFLTTSEQVHSYKNLVNEFVIGNLSIGTFSENGPKKCSGLDIKQYSKDELSNEFASSFDKLECIVEDHQTPFDTTQNFTFCFFRRR